MDKKEAKMVLQALRPNDLDASIQPTFAEALGIVESDPELKVWWDAQQAFDRAVISKLKEIPMPEDLRMTILAGQKIEQFRPQHLRFSYWLAAAAAIAIFCALGTSQYIKNYGPLPTGEYVAAVMPLLNDDSPSLALTSDNHAQVIAWLKQQNSPTGNLPAPMAAAPTYGCQKYVVHGHAVSLICFATSAGGVAHLFIVDKRALTDPPSSRAPEMSHGDGWCTACWSDDHMSYVLTTKSGPDALRQLL